jgi:hypothetical protein
MNKIVFVAVLAFAATVLASDEKCKKASEIFVDYYNHNVEDAHNPRELHQTTGCWTVGDDLHLSLIMKTGNGYYKSCLNVIVESADNPTRVTSFGTCR